MIQRKQSLYLLLAFICNVLMFVFPVFSVSAKSLGATYEGYFGPFGLESEDYSQSFPIFIVYIVMAILTAVGIALYKNRSRQLMLCRLNLIFHILIAVGYLTFYYAGKGAVMDRMSDKGFSDISFGVEIGFFLLVAAIPFILLAIRGIKADMILLQSIERLR